MELAVRTNHVHVLVGYGGIRPETMVREIKARATRWLHERRLVKPDERIWAARAGSCRYIWRNEQVDAVAAHARDGQDVPH